MLIDQLTPITSDRFWDAPLKVVLGGLFLALVAPIELALTVGPVAIPITLQSLMVLLLACLLGSWRSSLAVLLYLLLGVFGLPVYAGGGYGWEHLFGPTGGFLFGFVLIAWLAGRAAEQSWGSTWWGTALIMLGGHLVLLVIGGIWLGIALSWETVRLAFPPLFPGLLVKSAIGTLLILLLNTGMHMMLAARKRRDES